MPGALQPLPSFPVSAEAPPRPSLPAALLCHVAGIRRKLASVLSPLFLCPASKRDCQRRFASSETSRCCPSAGARELFVAWRGNFRGSVHQSLAPGRNMGSVLSSLTDAGWARTSASRALGVAAALAGRPPWAAGTAPFVSACPRAPHVLHGRALTPRAGLSRADWGPSPHYLTCISPLSPLLLWLWERHLHCSQRLLLPGRRARGHLPRYRGWGAVARGHLPR